MVSDSELIARITDYYAGGAGSDVDVRRIGAFALVLHRTSDLWYLSYATPIADPGGDALAQVRAIVAAFTAAARVPGFEWIDEVAPGLDRTLVAAGFPEAEVEPLLVVDAQTLTFPAVDGARAEVVVPQDDIRSLRQVAHDTFPELGDLTDAEVELIAAEISSGQRIQVAVHMDGRPVAVGSHSPWRGVTEITGVGTLPAYRRRGLAGLVTATLAAEAFATGIDVVYLTAGSDDAASVYRRVGFRRAATARTTSLRQMLPVDAQRPRD